MSLASPRLSGGPLIMGIVNVTPDSFSDGGQFADPARAGAHAAQLVEEGADILDVGGESSRPGAAPVSQADEMTRVVPAIAAIRALTNAPISIDTTKPAVARAAFHAGANMWNDITALQGQGAAATAAELGGEIVLMHMQGEPRTMQANPQYTDVIAEVIAFLKARIAALEEAGAARANIWADPGFGFGKTLAHNLALTNAIARIRAETGARLLFGASRKSSIAQIDPGAAADQRLGGSLVLALAAAAQGADMLRVHDVRATVQALKTQRALANSPRPA